MVLKFKCEKCGGEIVVKYLKPGEEALCRNCGARVAVPETSVEAGEEPDLKEIRRYRATGKPPDPLEVYCCPACGGTNLNKDLWNLWFGGISRPWFRQSFTCGDCGALFCTLHPKFGKGFWFLYMLAILIAAALVTYILRVINEGF
jgi:DNA-directed RNA polymerase subunit RPC12/RpoP